MIHYPSFLKVRLDLVSARFMRYLLVPMFYGSWCLSSLIEGEAYLVLKGVSRLEYFFSII